MQFAYNPFTDELDVIGTANQNGFLPYDVISAGLSITVPAYRENNTVEELVVLGELTVLGSVALLAPAIIYAYRAITAAYTVSYSDRMVDCTANSFTVTLPSAVGFNAEFIIRNAGTGVITLGTSLAQTINDAASGVLTLSQYDSISLRSNNANWMIV